MLSDAQNLYLQEVLGLNPAHFLASTVTLGARPVTKSESQKPVVMTSALQPEETALLHKILASVRLDNYTHISEHVDVVAPHVLVFGGALTHGRHQLGSAVWWSLPALGSMLGSGPSVFENKKLTWSLLQQMVKELA